MTRVLKYISRIGEDFDTVISGVNGVILHGDNVDADAVDTLIKLYQSGKHIVLASNTGMRVLELFEFLKKRKVPMSIFSAMITAGEVAHFYLKNNATLGNTYYSLTADSETTVKGLRYTRTDSVVLSDFVLATTTLHGVDLENLQPVLEQALDLDLPLICIGNNTSVMNESSVEAGIGAVAEQYAMMGGKIVSFGKPDVRIAAYLTESLPNFSPKRSLVVGDGMPTDMRMGNVFGAQTLLIVNGVHQIKDNIMAQVDELSKSYGLRIDYCMENLQW